MRRRRRVSCRCFPASPLACTANTQPKEATMAEDGHRRAMEALRKMEADAIEKARAAGAQARAAASQPGQKAATEVAVVSIPALGPYKPPTPGEQAAMAAGAQM